MVTGVVRVEQRVHGRRPQARRVTQRGCDERCACAQNIASLPSWWFQTNASTAGLDRHAPFLAWYFK